MKKVIRCSNCFDCYIYRSSVGFLAKDQLYCSYREEDVDPDDGCTFGHRGAPVRARKAIGIDISNQAKVNGYNMDQESL